METDISSILIELGYKLRKSNDYYQCKALYRGGDSDTSLAIYPQKNLVIDFVTGEKFSINHLLALSLNLKSDEEVKIWLDNKNYQLPIFKIQEEKLEGEKIFPSEILKNLLQDHSYWQNRGISLEVLKLFSGGIGVGNGRLKNRYIIPIFNGKNQIIGFNARTLIDSSIKYKTIGQKKNFRWPLHINLAEIKEKKSIILVEGMGCVFSLFEVEIKNCMCLFGTELSFPQLNTLLKLNLDKIIIATNNDGENGPGNEAAQKIYRKLNRYIDSRNLVIALPLKKDFNELIQEKEGNKLIKEWYINIENET